MFWKRHKPDWLIDPSKVMFGSVVDRSRNLSRSHVRVKYLHEAEARFEPLVAFIRNCREALRTGRSLGIEHLLVAPITRRRHAGVFDLLTDWVPATRRAYATLPRGQRRPEMRDS